MTAKAHVTRNARVVGGGEPVALAHSLTDCWNACLARASACRGFDFAGSTPPDAARCFLHGRQSICDRLEHLPAFDNYRFHLCGIVRDVYSSVEFQRHLLRQLGSLPQLILSVFTRVSVIDARLSYLTISPSARHAQSRWYCV